MKDKLVARAKKNYRNYQIISQFRAGIVLTGQEIKSVRHSQISLDEAYVRPFDQELYLINLHIASYQSISSDPRRKRKLLLWRSEITKIMRQLRIKNYVLVPLQILISQRGWAKVEIALAQRLRQYQVKEKIKEREIDKKLKNEDY